MHSMIEDSLTFISFISLTQKIDDGKAAALVAMRVLRQASKLYARRVEAHLKSSNGTQAVTVL